MKIPIPIFLQNPVFTAAAFPIYQPTGMAVFPLVVSEGGNFIASTQAICFMGAMAVKALQEKAAAIAIRQVVRATAKAVAAYQIRNELGDLGGLFASAYNFISENADLRSWATLPFDAQILRVSIPVGEHQLVMTHAASGATAVANVTIVPKGKTVIRVIRAGGRLYFFNLTA